MSAIKTILVADDDSALLKMIQEALSVHGYSCETAEDGTTALDILNRRSSDLMITDVVMPGINGFELTEKAKQLHPAMLVMVMTGFSEEDSYNRAIVAGASDFIKKPFTINELLVRIGRIDRDSLVLAEIRKREQELKTVSQEMISGVQDESLKRITDLEQAIKKLKENIAGH
ncbi:MAG: response regulator [Nitrospirae bacterium]|nr:response regulator [Nitrospirota bacterium]